MRVLLIKDACTEYAEAMSHITPIFVSQSSHPRSKTFNQYNIIFHDNSAEFNILVESEMRTQVYQG